MQILLFQHMPNNCSALPHSRDSTYATTGDLKTKNTQRNYEYLRRHFRIQNMQEKPYLLVLNNGFPIQDLGQRNAVTPAGSNCPITPGSRLLPARSRVCQRDSSNLRHRILLVSELERVRTVTTTSESLHCHKRLRGGKAIS